MIHGSTVTYSAVLDNAYVFGEGVSDGDARMLSMASSSACRVACTQKQDQIPSQFCIQGSESTFFSSLVRLRARAMIWPSRTNTHPTGISLAAKASSAYTD